MRRQDYTKRSSRESISQYSPRENRLAKQKLVDENRQYQDANQNRSDDFDKQNPNSSYNVSNPIYADPNNPNSPQHKTKRKHKIEIWIASITAIATIIGVGITYLGYKQNQQKQMAQQPKTEKIYHDKQTPKPKIKTRTKVKKIVEKPKDNQADIQRDQKLKQEADQAKQQASQSAKEAAQKASQAKQKTQSSATHKGGAIHRTLANLKNKFSGYEQKPSSNSNNNEDNN